MSESIEKPMRLHAYLASLGIASRRSCEEMIREGRVTVDGVKASIGQKIICNQRIEIDGQPIIAAYPKKFRYILLNKPKGYLSSLSDPYGRPCAIDLISGEVNERIYNIGRLDQWSSGLLLFTNDGDLASKLMHPSGQMEKEYRIQTNVPIPDNFASSFMRGIIIDGVRYRARSVHITGPNSALIVLIEGKNREIRRVLEHFELHTRLLERIRYGPICDPGLAPGNWRELTVDEVQALKTLCNPNQKSQREGTMRVAIDGPAGSGKSTIAKMIAERLGFLYINSGSLYRAIAFLALREGVAWQDVEKMINLAKKHRFDCLSDGSVIVDEECLKEELRTPEVDDIVSQVSAIPEIRAEVNNIIRRISEGKDVVSEGRDITTVVFPDADVKLYLDASPKIRAERRYRERLSKKASTKEEGAEADSISIEEVRKNIEMRDKLDAQKPIGALKIAEDAIYLDTSDLTIEQVYDKVYKILRARIAHGR